MGAGNRHSTSQVIDLPLMVKLAAGSQRNIKLTRELLKDLFSQLDKELNLGIDKSSLNTLKGLEEAASKYAISIKQSGREFEVMTKNAQGMLGYAKGIAGFWSKSGGKWEASKSEVLSSGTQIELSPNVSRLITVTKEYETQANLVNRLIKQGYAFEEQGSARYNILQNEQTILTKREKAMNEALAVAKDMNAQEDSQLKHTIDRTNETKQRVQLAKQEAEEQARLNKEAKDGAKYTGSIYKNIKSMLTNVVVYGTAYKALYAVMNGFKETINIVKELDKSLVDLQIATGKTREEASQMLDTYNELAQSVGATTRQVADSATTWLRQGYSEADTNKLIYDSMVLSKVGMIESAEATKYLTSAMKGYQVSVDDAMSIVDKLSKIDLNAAVSSGELAEAMSKTANSARLAGVSMDELLGYIATTAEVTQQSASTVGTAFKSLFSRFSKIAAGTFVDEETGENLNEISRVLGKLNIELYRTDGSMRSVSDVLKEVSAGWKNYTDVEKNSISTAVAGRRLPEYIVICSAA